MKACFNYFCSLVCMKRNQSAFCRLFFSDKFLVTYDSADNEAEEN